MSWRMRMRKNGRGRGGMVLAVMVIIGGSMIAMPRAYVARALGKLGIAMVTSVPKPLPTRVTVVNAAPVVKPAAKDDKDTFLVIYATTSGFEPKEITTRPGQHLIMIRNRSGVDNITYKVIDEKEKDNSKKEKFKVKTTVGANAVTRLALGVGEFLVVDESDAENICRIKVEP